MIDKEHIANICGNARAYSRLNFGFGVYRPRRLGTAAAILGWSLESALRAEMLREETWHSLQRVVACRWIHTSDRNYTRRGGVFRLSTHPQARPIEIVVRAGIDLQLNARATCRGGS